MARTRAQELCAQLPKLTIPTLLTEFTLFPDLPRELRNKIWFFVAHEPRYLKLFQFTEIKENSDPEDRLQPKNPIILRVSREGREEGLRYYTPCHNMGGLDEIRRAKIYTLPQSIQTALKSHPMYINFEVDKFCHKVNSGKDIISFVAIDGPTLYLNFNDSVIRKLKHLRQTHGYRYAAANFTGPKNLNLLKMLGPQVQLELEILHCQYESDGIIETFQSHHDWRFIKLCLNTRFENALNCPHVKRNMDIEGWPFPISFLLKTLSDVELFPRSSNIKRLDIWRRDVSCTVL